MSFEATGEFVFIRVDQTTTTPGGILLPETVQAESPLVGTVESVGENVELDVEPGDRVLFENYGGFDVGDGVVAIRDANVLGVSSQRPAERDAIYDEIDQERAYQDGKWGGACNDDTQGEAEWQRYIREYSQGECRGAKYDFRTRMVKTAALAVAAIESVDRRAEQGELA